MSSPLTEITGCVSACFDSISESEIRIVAPDKLAATLTFATSESLEQHYDLEKPLSVHNLAAISAFVISDGITRIDEWTTEKYGLVIALGNAITAIKAAEFHYDMSNTDQLLFRVAEELFLRELQNVEDNRPGLLSLLVVKENAT
jgi:hypothetical protein